MVASPHSPLLILGYSSLGVLHLYHSSFSFDPGRARLFGYAYFSVGLLSSLAVIYTSLRTGAYETPLLFAVIGSWGFLSLVGIAMLGELSEELDGFVSVALMFLVALSGLISSLTAEW